LYPAAFFGGTASDDTRKEVYAALQRGVKAFSRVVRFGPYVAGPALTHADCAAMVHLPLISSTTKVIYGEDVLAGVPGLKDYLAMMAQRPHVLAVNEARKAGMEEFLAYRRAAAERAQAAKLAQAGR
jgi:glutathione S-transferase